jgi:hypothetical protein
VNRGIRLQLAALCLVAASCAPRLVTLPSGAGTAFPDFARAYDQATESCRSVRTLAGILAISGRAGTQRFRAKVDAGFEAPAKVRLELPAPGKPIFTYVAVGDEATLVLPREGRVLRNAPPAATLEALAGVAIGPGDLRTIVTGCGFASGEPSRGRSFDSGWVAVDAGDATSWLQQVDGAWRLTAAINGPVEVRYADFSSGRPATIRLRASIGQGNGQGASTTDLTIRLSQVDINGPLDSAVFQVDIPPDATPMTLEQLRQAGPLGR